MDFNKQQLSLKRLVFFLFLFLLFKKKSEIREKAGVSAESSDYQRKGREDGKYRNENMNTDTVFIPPFTHQCSFGRENNNNQNFLERLSWRALLLNLREAGDLPGDAALPARGDKLGRQEGK